LTIRRGKRPYIKGTSVARKEGRNAFTRGEYENTQYESKWNQAWDRVGGEVHSICVRKDTRRRQRRAGGDGKEEGKDPQGRVRGKSKGQKQNKRKGKMGGKQRKQKIIKRERERGSGEVTEGGDRRKTINGKNHNAQKELSPDSGRKQVKTGSSRGQNWIGKRKREKAKEREKQEGNELVNDKDVFPPNRDHKK